MMKAKLSVLIFLSFLAACASNTPIQSVSSPVMAEPDRVAVVAPDQEYRIGPLDKISIRVFGQPDLSIDKVQVDASGQIVLPLIGVVNAGGQTSQSLSTEIAAKLKEKYLQNPSVSVLIEEAVSQRVTVTGAVIESGIYPLRGPTTLLQAVSMAKGPDPKAANLKQVAIFRTIDGKRARAVFDLAAIRAGSAEDPAIYGGDTIIVADSKGQRAWREIIGAVPVMGIFTFF